MLCSPDRELVDRVVQDHLRNICERLAELSEDEPGVVSDDLQVHEVTAAALYGERVVSPVALAETDEVAPLQTTSKQRLGRNATDGAVVPTLFFKQKVIVECFVAALERGMSAVVELAI